VFPGVSEVISSFDRMSPATPHAADAGALGALRSQSSQRQLQSDRS
jgi:hypothetical protein